MKLTGKYKEDFEKWILMDDDSEEYRFGQALSTNFDQLPLSFQWGVIVDFADSKGYLLKVQYLKGEYYYAVLIKDSNKTGLSGYEQSRPKAREKAIERFNEIYNNNENI